jgi:RNA polymerase sigma-70 factor (ECF subfamily)
MTDEFQNLLIQFLPRLKGYAMLLCRDQALADDILQETAVKALRARDSFALGTNFAAWIHTILRNEFLNVCRYNSKWKPSGSQEAAERVAAPDDQETTVFCREVARCLQRLPFYQREALILVSVGSYSYEEAAVILKCPLGTLKSRVARARETMKDMLLPESSDSMETGGGKQDGRAVVGPLGI